MPDTPTRRGFLQATAAAGATASALTLPAASYAKVLGANGNVNLAFLGTGGRCQQHIDVALKMRDEKKGVMPFAVCDVWDGDPTKGKGKGQGLFPAAKRCDIPADDKKRVSKDFRVVLDNPDVDAVCIATPDHWHARHDHRRHGRKGKHVYCEKPMTQARLPSPRRSSMPGRRAGKVMSVGVQSMADPTWLHGQRASSRPARSGTWCRPRRATTATSGRRPVALLLAHQGHEPEDDRLGHVPRPPASTWTA